MTLPQAIGLRRAREMSFTGNYVDAGHALRIGLVNRVVPHDELLDSARALAGDIASNDPVVVAAIRRTYLDVADTLPSEELERDRAEAFRFDPEEVARRREGVIARGRAQVRPDGG